MEEVITVVLVGDKTNFSNGFYQLSLGFCHNIPNLKDRPESVKSILMVQLCCGIHRSGNLPLKHDRNKMRNMLKHVRHEEKIKDKQVPCIGI